MKRCIKSSFYILLTRKQFKFIFSASLSLSLLSFLLKAVSYFGQYCTDVRAYRDICIISSANAMSQILITALPILSTAAFCDIYIDDKKSNRLSIIFQKCKRGEYYFSSLIVCSLSPVFTVFAPVIINLLLCAITFPNTSPAELTGLASNQAYLYSAQSEYMTALVFKKLFILHPFLYSLLYAVFMTLYSCAGAALTYSLSYFIKNRGMIIVPFFAFNALTIICDSFFLKHFKISTSAENYILSESVSEGINFGMFFALISLMAIVVTALSKKNISKLGDLL